MNNENARIYQTISKGKQIYPFSLEHVLPDYRPSIRKILLAIPRIKSFQSLAASDLIHFGGELAFTLLCESEDSELFSVVLTQNFACTADAMSVTSETEVFARPQIVKCDCRPQSQRKLTVKTEIEIAHMAVEGHILTPQIQGTISESDMGSVEKQTTTVISSQMKTLKEIELRMSSDIATDSVLPPIETVLTCDIHPFIDEIRCYDGRTTLKGRAIADIIYLNRDGDETHPIRIRHTSPFTLQHDDLSLQRNMAVQGQVCVKDIEAVITDDAYGEKRLIELDFSLLFDLCLLEEKECEIVIDAYSTAFESELQKESLPYLKSESAFQISVSDETDVGASVSESVRPLAAKVTAAVTGTREENSKLVFDLSLHVASVLEQDGSERFVTVEKNDTAKIVTSLPMPADPFDANAFCDVSVNSIRVENGLVKVQYELLFSSLLTRSMTVEAVSTIGLQRENRIQEKRNMILVYPEAGEGVWDIAKKYHIPTEAAAANRRGEGVGYYCLRAGKYVCSKIL